MNFTLIDSDKHKQDQKQENIAHVIHHRIPRKAISTSDA